MENNFNLGDIIVFSGRVYKITSIHLVNWLDNARVYGLSLLHSNMREPFDGKELYVCDHILRNVTKEDLQKWKVLYGSKT